MNMRDAILLAADHIENNPDGFKFSAIQVPGNECGTPGCALGWIGHFFGLSAGALSEVDVPSIIGISGDWHMAKQIFYDRMDICAGGCVWRCDAAACATGMRSYADLFHAAPKSIRPTSVLVAELMAKIAGPRIAEDA